MMRGSRASDAHTFATMRTGRIGTAIDTAVGTETAIEIGTETEIRTETAMGGTASGLGQPWYVIDETLPVQLPGPQVVRTRHRGTASRLGECCGCSAGAIGRSGKLSRGGQLARCG